MYSTLSFPFYAVDVSLLIDAISSTTSPGSLAIRGPGRFYTRTLDGPSHTAMVRPVQKLGERATHDQVLGLSPFLR